MTENQADEIAFSLLPGTTARERLEWLEHCGSIKAVFEELSNNRTLSPKKNLNAESLTKAYARATESLSTLQKNQINTLFVRDEDYPFRLRECADAPTLLYMKGNCNLNSAKVLSVVGTRKATPYGRDVTNHILRSLGEMFPELIIVSGLAYGIDAIAHQAALDSNLKTVAVLAHGLQEVYPKSHYKLAQDILNAGGCLISEHPWGVPSMKHQFLERNRIVAGMCDACLIIESGAEGGSMTTARLARDYNRDVMALPGRISDKQSMGCNKLIRSNIASLVESAEDIAALLDWEIKYEKAQQGELFKITNPQLNKLLDSLGRAESLTITELSQNTRTPLPELLTQLLDLELLGLVENLPGGKYRKILRRY